MEMRIDNIVQVRVDSDSQRRAARPLHAMGLSVSDAIRLLDYSELQSRRSD